MTLRAVATSTSPASNALPTPDHNLSCILPHCNRCAPAFLPTSCPPGATSSTSHCLGAGQRLTATSYYPVHLSASSWFPYHSSTPLTRAHNPTTSPPATLAVNLLPPSLPLIPSYNPGVTPGLSRYLGLPSTAFNTVPSFTTTALL
ncbi:hypothetical protein K503DRAFT_771681 [Rhizopogon vinicolor AM-OR11-026]|uniref:Uncharacterized protein n=1 Tax=Rhizopogon vinicolor AM-OR11-026 TaxID=1314800 RepID=A0A1B7MXH2_9AGAM|nr:hypothetical protein K503DRAFT_771681 [Rhizopogon vinicolor AM-OR11-026]